MAKNRLPLTPSMYTAILGGSQVENGADFGSAFSTRAGGRVDWAELFVVFELFDKARKVGLEIVAVVDLANQRTNVVGS